MEMKKLLEAACAVRRPMRLGRRGEGGQVACALESASGRVYTGICADLPCSLGFCAEQAAAAEMLKAGETRVLRLAAVGEGGEILPPCGRCREFLLQLDPANLETLAAVAPGRALSLRELLPEPWDREEPSP